MAEVYWDLEWTMQQQGFDYAYDKRLYDRFARGTPGRCASISRRAGLPEQAGPFSGKPRRAAGGGDVLPGSAPAAAVITFLSPGLRFFHQGQFQGRTKRISPHLCRGPAEPTDEALEQFYERLLAVLRQPVLREGQWQLLECVPAWDGNWTSEPIRPELPSWHARLEDGLQNRLWTTSADFRDAIALAQTMRADRRTGVYAE